jgi:hypothetical protein
MRVFGSPGKEHSTAGMIGTLRYRASIRGVQTVPQHKGGQVYAGVILLHQ